MRITARFLAGSLMVAALGACGGGSSSPTAPAPTPAPTPTPISYSGTYVGPMTFTAGSGGTLPVTGTTTVTHSSGSVSLTSLTTTYQGSALVTFPLGSAPFGTTFTGSTLYTSTGCGTITSTYSGYFGQNGSIMKMNLQVTLTPTSITSGCGVNDVRGELTRN